MAKKRQLFTAQLGMFTLLTGCASAIVAGLTLARGGAIDSTTALATSLAVAVVVVYVLPLLKDGFSTPRALMLHAIAFVLAVTSILVQGFVLFRSGVEQPVFVLADGVTHLSGEWIGMLGVLPIGWSGALLAHAAIVIYKHRNAIDKM